MNNKNLIIIKDTNFKRIEGYFKTKKEFNSYCEHKNLTPVEMTNEDIFTKVHW